RRSPATDFNVYLPIAGCTRGYRSAGSRPASAACAASGRRRAAVVTRADAGSGSSRSGQGAAARPAALDRHVQVQAGQAAGQVDPEQPADAVEAVVEAAAMEVQPGGHGLD